LYNHLNNFYKDVIDKNTACIDEDYINYQRKNMKIKYNQYKEKFTSKKNANNNMIEVFKKVENETIDNFNKIKKINYELYNKEIGY
jgi:parvulin-like peptidyl-prolyl isomerase